MRIGRFFVLLFVYVEFDLVVELLVGLRLYCGCMIDDVCGLFDKVYVELSI